jgi:DUF1365 family protein
MHHRFTPKVHHFEHRIFMFYLDLDELDVVAKQNYLFSRNGRNIYNFCDEDHEPAGRNSLKERVLEYLQHNGIDLGKRGHVRLLTLPRVFGHLFNPISIYYCFDGAEKPVCCVAEVGNTYREMKLYLLGCEQLGVDNTFQKVVAKHFYVSPFSSLTLNFEFKLKVPAHALDIKIDDRAGDDKVLISTLTGRRVKLTNRALAWFTFKYPLITLKVIFLIHYQALRLWLKRIPFYRKAENLSLQREVLRPHSTLATETK